MKRVVSAAAAILMAAVLVPATASAADLQIGVTASPVISPTCPANAQGGACKIVLTQVTAYETLRDGVVNPDKIQEAGVISSFTLGLTGTSLITAKVLTALDKTYGGPPEAQLTSCGQPARRAIPPTAWPRSRRSSSSALNRSGSPSSR